MKYKEPIIEILQYKMQDVICTSPEFGGNLDQDGGDEDGGFAPQ